MAGLSARIDTSGTGFNDSNFNDPLQVPYSVLKSGIKYNLGKPALPYRLCYCALLVIMRFELLGAHI